MPLNDKPAALVAADVPPRTKPSNYPEPFASRMAGRVKRPLGDVFGLKNFGVNLTCLLPGAISALHHRHSRQDEFIYVLDGAPTLITDAGQTHEISVAGPSLMNDDVSARLRGEDHVHRKPGSASQCC